MEALPLLLLSVAAVAGPEVAAAPGVLPPVAPQYFRIDPGAPDTTYQLLVVPVRFADDLILGGGDLEARLDGSDPATLRGYYLAATGSKLDIQVTLAPSVTTSHPTSWYTTDPDGQPNYGVDPAAYPRNGQGLVEEVTARLMDRVDFKQFDNTGDGIADGLLLLHSGTPAPEGGGFPPPGSMLDHAFTVPEPVPRGSALVFPYAIAATRDAVGPWAHETGHLYGLADLYVIGYPPFCPPGPGLGEWSLMATGANVDGGRDPSALDAFSRQTLGFEAVTTVGVPVPLQGDTFLRVYRAGEAGGPRYFLVERRTGENGLGPEGPATVVYYVDEDADLNTGCGLPLLATVRAVVCSADVPCSTRLDDFTTPSLRDPDGTPTGLVLEFTGDTVLARYEATPPLGLARVQLGVPSADPERSQAIILSVQNLQLQAGVDATLRINSLSAEACLTGPPSWTVFLPPGGTVTDSLWRITGCDPGAPLAPTTSLYEIVLTETGTVFTNRDTLVLPSGPPGLSPDSLRSFQPLSRRPGTASPWREEAGEWVAGPLEPLADGDLASPWFTVPAGGTVVLAHSWQLASLSPDVCLDGAQVRLLRQAGSEVVLEPPGGWGYTVERGVGNALAGMEVLSGVGSRTHVLDLAPYAGDPVRLLLRAAGDAEEQGGEWRVADIGVGSVPPVSFTLGEDPFDPGLVVAETGSPFVPGIDLTLFRGSAAVTPGERITVQAWQGETRIPLGRAELDLCRFDLVWSDPSGNSATTSARIEGVYQPRQALLPPYPNPVISGSVQTWTLQHGDGDSPGTYELLLFDVQGQLLTERAITIAVPEVRRVSWMGTDDTGVPVAAGVYFLQARSPAGRVSSQKVVVLPR
jgi:M6 family metalloprotease-like protein